MSANPNWNVGMRVMVRTQLSDASGFKYTDHLGYITAITESELTLETRKGQVCIPWQEVSIGKEIPPPPQRRVAKGEPS